MFSAAPASVATRMATACAALGVAFQLSDDILDVSSDRAQSGKTPGTDLREGIRTLPMLHALRSGGARDARLIELLRQEKITDPAQHSEALSLLREHPAMELARQDLRRWAEVARDEIRGLPPLPARDAFETICEFVVERSG
jgi:heptaprenyl diphosphate synthase